MPDLSNEIKEVEQDLINLNHQLRTRPTDVSHFSKFKDQDAEKARPQSQAEAIVKQTVEKVLVKKNLDKNERKDSSEDLDGIIRR